MIKRRSTAMLHGRRVSLVLAAAILLLAAGVLLLSLDTTSETAKPPPPPTPTTVRPPPPPTPPAVEAQIGDVLDRLGSVAFNAPTELRLGDSVVIQLVLSAERSVRELQKELTEIGEREGARIEISRRMEARLTGSGFRIEATTPELQAVRPNRVTEWSWQIEPTEAGRQRLNLTLSALIDVDGESTPYAVETFRRELDIRVSWTRTVTGFVGRNWQWLSTAILIPLIGWIWHNRRRSPPASA